MRFCYTMSLVLLVFGLVTGVTGAEEQSLNLGGYIEDTVLFEQRPQSIEGDDDFGTTFNTARVRLDLSGALGDKGDYAVAAVSTTYSGNTSVQVAQYLPDSVLEAYPDLFWYLLEYQFEDDIWLQEAYCSLYLGDFKFRVGRQKYYTGTGYAWNPTDLFNAKNVLDPTYEIEGLDALYGSWSIAGENELTLFYSFGTSQNQPDREYREFKDGDFQVKFRTHLDIWDMAVHYSDVKMIRTDYQGVFDAVIFPTDARMLTRWKLLAAEASGELFGFGIRLEGGYAWLELYDDPYGQPCFPDESMARAWSDRYELLTDDIRDHGRFLVSMDYTFENDLYVIGEYYYDGLGKESSDDYLLNDRLALFAGERDTIGKHNVFVGGTYPTTDFTTFELYSIVNVSDGSVIINPWFTWFAADDIVLFMSIQWPLGDEESSLGQSGPTAFARLKVSF